MRVLLTHRPGGAYSFISDGWGNALTAKGHTVQRWDGEAQTWDRFSPDLAIGCSGHRQPIPKKPNRGACKVAIHVNPYGPINVEPNINEAKHAIDWVTEQSPDAVFGYGHEEDRKYWSYWTEKLKFPWVPMPTAGDATLYGPQHSINRTADIVFVGGRWDYKAKNIDRYLLPILQAGKLKYVLAGWGGWPHELGCTQVEDSYVPRLLASAKVGPCVSEPHTSRYGIDLPERLFKVALSGTFVVHDVVPGLDRYIPGLVGHSTPLAYSDAVAYAVNNYDAHLSTIESYRKHILENHTYFNRMSVLLGELGFLDASRGMLK